MSPSAALPVEHSCGMRLPISKKTKDSANLQAIALEGKEGSYVRQIPVHRSVP